MRFTNPYSTHLGTFTWAELQAAYPNGGGALAALPAGITAFVSDLGINGGSMVVPDAGKTRWTTLAPVTLYQGAIAALTGTTAYTVVNTTAIYAGLLEGHSIEISGLFTIVGTAAVKDFRWKYGGSVISDKNTPNTTILTRIDRRIVGLGAGSQVSDRTNLLTIGYEAATSTFYSTSVNSGVAQDLTLEFKLTNSADSVQATSYSVVLV